MKGAEKVIDLLNEILTAELTAINQYWIHARMCHNWGYHRLYEKIRHESIDEMKHADELVMRILFYDAVPNLQRLGKVTVGQSVPEMLRLDLTMEQEALERFNRGVALCAAEGDNGTREVLETMLRSEEDHVDWLETQLHLIEQLGEAQYLAQQLHS